MIQSRVLNQLRNWAPNIYASQNRLLHHLTLKLLFQGFTLRAESVTSYGGEELDPPQFGKVFISIKPYNGVFLSEEVKRNIQLQLREYSVVGIITEITDLKYLYVDVESNVYYDTNKARCWQSFKSNQLSLITS